MAASKPRGIKRLSDRPIKVNAIIYADPGTGKTLVAASSAIVGPCLLLNGGRPDGPESARAILGRAYGKEVLRRLEVWDMNDYGDLDEAYSYLKRKRRDRPYRWVWFDDSTLFQDKGMDQIMAELLKKKPQRDPDIPDMAQYLKNQNRLGKWIRNMALLPYNFGITAHVMQLDLGDEETINMPGIAGGGKIPLSSKVCGYMSIVGRLYVTDRSKGGKKELTRVLQVDRSERWYAKDGFGGVLGGRIIRPSIPKIEELIRNGGK